MATLLRRYHEAVAEISLSPDITWPTQPPSRFAGKTIGHMDVSLSNVVCKAGNAIGLIDFEEIGPVAPIWDVARTVRHWIPLIHPSDLQGELHHVHDQQSFRLRLFANAYGLTTEEREQLVDAVLINADVTYERMRKGAADGHAGYLREWTQGAAERNRRGRLWVESHRDELALALHFES